MYTEHPVVFTILVFLLTVCPPILGMIWVVRRLMSPGVCAVCGTSTNDSYVDARETSVSLCRNHLMERWRADALASKQHLVYIEPDFARYPGAYLCATTETLKQWEYAQADCDAVEAVLSAIPGKTCESCGASATMAFVKMEDYHPPSFETISAHPAFLCAECVVRRLEPILRNAREDFAEGLYAPTNGPGVYHVQKF